jgi:CHASE1-domain containing sensor protein
MSKKKQRPKSSGENPAAGRISVWAVLLLGLLLTGLAWNAARQDESARIRERFNFSAKRFELDLRNRLLSYEHMLRGGVGLLRSSDEVTPEDWALYVNSLDVRQYYPGSEGLGFAVHIVADQKEAFNARLRAAGFSDRMIWPEGDRSEYVPMVYIAPLTERTRRAIGFDMFSTPVRREALIRARDTGQTALSGKLISAVDDSAKAMIAVQIYAPVYRQGAFPETVAQRREALIGYVSCPLKMTDFMHRLSSEEEQVAVAIYDGGVPDDATLLYRGVGGTPDGFPSDRLSHFSRQTVFEFGGHSWLLVCSSTPDFEKDEDGSKANLILVFGVLISLLLTRLISIVIQSKRQAADLQKLTMVQETSNHRLVQEVAIREKAEVALSERARELDSFNAAMIGREDRVIELKEEVNRCCRELGREPAYPPVWNESGAMEKNDDE